MAKFKARLRNIDLAHSMGLGSCLTIDMVSIFCTD